MQFLDFDVSAEITAAVVKEMGSNMVSDLNLKDTNALVFYALMSKQVYFAFV